MFRGVILSHHFRQDKTNLALPEEDRLKYISNPEYVWWNVLKKKPTHRFIHKFTKPIEFFFALWNDVIINHICDTTEVLTYNHIRRKLNKQDVLVFLGMELTKGFIGMRNSKYFWGENDVEVSFPFKDKILTKNYYFSIARSLNFDPEFVHKALIDAFKLYLIPGYNMTIDELRIPCHHEGCPFKNHNNDKPDIWAIESKSLHAENGYLLDFINPIQNNLPTPSQSVFQFAYWLKTTERHHHILADSNFLSALDILKLSDMGFESTVSCRSNRPTFIWQKGLSHLLPRGYTRVASSKRLCCVATHNKGIPKLATTLCTAREFKGSFVVKERRDILRIYDKYKGKADSFGHLFKSQFPMTRHKSWMTSLLVGWFYFALTNSFILYNMRFLDLTHVKYVRQIAKDLLSFQ